MPFVIINSGCTFQRVVHEMLCDIPHIFVYIDGILVSSQSVEEHKHHLQEVFSRLHGNNLMVNMDKYVIAQPTGLTLRGSAPP